MNKFVITEFNSIKTKKSSNVFQFDTVRETIEFFDKLEIIQVEEKQNTPTLHLFGRLEDQNGGRVKSNFSDTQFLILDIDHTTSEEIKNACLTLSKYAYVLIETYSSTLENPRYRLIVLTKERINLNQFQDQKLSSRLAKFLEISEIDRCSNNPVQVYYAPSAPVGQSRTKIANLGEELFSLSLLPTEKSNSTKKSSSDDESVYLVEAERLIEERYDGGLLYVENESKFYIYENGIWESRSKNLLIKELLFDEYKKNDLLSKIKSTVETLKFFALTEKFPSVSQGDNTLVFDSCSFSPSTQKVLPHSKTQYARNKLNFDYDPKATCPHWLKFLNDIWGLDSDHLQKEMLLQEYMGLCLTNITKFGKMLWLIGHGSNGKSVILDVTIAMVGKDNSSAVPLKDFGGRFKLIDLVDKLVNIDADMEIDAVLADHSVKKVVTGDLISVEQKGEPAFTCSITAKILGAANELPKTKDSSHGFFRRLMTLEFNRIFTDQEQDKELTPRLKTELPGIFNWAVEGLARLLENGAFTVPESSIKTIEEYKLGSNPVAQFVEYHTDKINVVTHPQLGTATKDLYNEYREFCASNGYSPLNANNFGVKLKSFGIERYKFRQSRYYPVRLKNTEEYKRASLFYSDDTPRNIPKKVSIDDVFA
jgi:putative DNA primase/helicase